MTDHTETPAAANDDLARFQCDCRELLVRAYEGKPLVPDEGAIRVDEMLDADAEIVVRALGTTPFCFLRINGEIVDTLRIDRYQSAMQLATHLLSRINQHAESVPTNHGAGRYHA